MRFADRQDAGRRLASLLAHLAADRAADRPVARSDDRPDEGSDTAVVVLGLLAGLAAGASLLMQPAGEWMAKAPETLNLLEPKLRALKRSVEKVSKAAEKVEKMATTESAPKAKPPRSDQAPLLSRILGGAQKALIIAAPTVVLLYFLLATGDLFLRKLVKVLPTLADKRRAVTVARTVQDEMAIYLFTITCINAGLGVATGVAMYFLGMPNPALWGTMAALFNYVPYLGPLATLIILTIVAVISFDGIGQTVAVPAVRHDVAPVASFVTSHVSLFPQPH